VDEIAAYFLEPVQGEGGYVVPPPDYFRKMEFLRKEGALFVSDEIQTGMGRTGKFFGIENFGVVPDMLTVAKGIASGLPLSALIARADVMKSWQPGQHASTFGANPVAVEAAIATLDVMKAEHLMANARTQGARALKRLREMQERYEIIGDVRGLGLLIGVEIVRSKRTKERGDKEAKEIMNHCFMNGLLVIMAGRNVIRLIPPLNTTTPQMDEGLDILEDAITTVNKTVAGA
jgi:4-aminobutyrate aminotransferase